MARKKVIDPQVVASALAEVLKEYELDTVNAAVKELSTTVKECHSTIEDYRKVILESGTRTTLTVELSTYRAKAIVPFYQRRKSLIRIPIPGINKLTGQRQRNPGRVRK